MMYQNRQSHSLESFQVLCQSRSKLTASATEKIRQFLKSQRAPEGGFFNRKGEVDLYYTFFGLINSIVLDLDLPVHQLKQYFDRFDYDTLSMVHLTCLVKCRAILQVFKGIPLDQTEINRYTQAILKFRTSNGSFSYDGQGQGFPYAAFIALNFYQDLGQPIDQQERLLSALEEYRTADGAYRNPAATQQGMLLSTVAALQVIRHLSDRIDEQALSWIKSQYQPVGGFTASAANPLPDMLSTAVALFTWAVCGESLASIRQPVGNFVDDHWDSCGGFRATVLDDICDCEYTYYGLLALGALYDNSNT
jgi:prenyltransferase beta subunit